MNDNGPGPELEDAMRAFVRANARLLIAACTVLFLIACAVWFLVSRSEARRTGEAATESAIMTVLSSARSIGDDEYSATNSTSRRLSEERRQYRIGSGHQAGFITPVGWKAETADGNVVLIRPRSETRSVGVYLLQYNEVATGRSTKYPDLRHIAVQASSCRAISSTFTDMPEAATESYFVVAERTSSRHAGEGFIYKFSSGAARTRQSCDDVSPLITSYDGTLGVGSYREAFRVMTGELLPTLTITTD